MSTKKTVQFIRESSGEYRSKCSRFRIEKDDRGWWTALYKGVAIAYERGYPEAEAAAQSYQPNLAAEIGKFTKEVNGLKEPQEGLVAALKSLHHACSQAMMRLNDAVILTLPFKADEMVVHKIGPTQAKLSFIVSIKPNPYNLSEIRITTAPATAKKQPSKVNLRVYELDRIASLRHLRDNDDPVWDSGKGAWFLPW